MSIIISGVIGFFIGALVGFTAKVLFVWWDEASNLKNLTVNAFYDAGKKEWICKIIPNTDGLSLIEASFKIDSVEYPTIFNSKDFHLPLDLKDCEFKIPMTAALSNEKKDSFNKEDLQDLHVTIKARKGSKRPHKIEILGKTKT